MKNPWKLEPNLKKPKTYGLRPTTISYIAKNFKKLGYRSESEMVEAILNQDEKKRKAEKAAAKAAVMS